MPGGVGAGKPAGSSLDSLVRAAEKDDVLLYLTAILGVVMPGVVYFLYHCVHNIYSDYAQKKEAKRLEEEREQSAITVFFASQGGRSAGLAQIVAQRLTSEAPPVVDLATLDPADFSSYKGIGLFIVSSASKGCAPEGAEWFFDWLEDIVAEKTSSKRRKQRPCCRMHFAIFGVGDSKYGPLHFNRAAKVLSRRLRAMGASPMRPLALGDQSKTISLEDQCDAWVDTLLLAIDEHPRRIAKRERKKSGWFGGGGSTSEESSLESDEPDDELAFPFAGVEGRLERLREGRYGPAGDDEESISSDGSTASELSNDDIAEKIRNVRHRKK